MRRIVICILLVIVIVGCTNRNDTKIESKNPEPEIATLGSLSIKDYIVSDMRYHDNKLIILYSANNNVNIAPAKLFIVDANDYGVLYEKELDSIYISAKIITLDKGFYINQGNNITIYDYELKVLRTIDLSKLQQGESRLFSESVFSISSDLKKVTYVNSINQSLVIYDFETKEEKVVYYLSDKKNHIMKFNQLYLMDNYVGFAGQYVYADNFEIAESNAYGRISIETGKIDKYEKKETTSKSYGPYMLIVDVMRVDDNDLGTGETIIYDIDNNKRTVVSLKESYNSFDVDILSANLIASYNDVGRNRAKLIVYQDGKNNVLDNAIPPEVLDISSCYDSQKNMLIIFYNIPSNEKIKSEIRGVELK